jgi:Ala-tRNA(Pro) deacylase
MAHLAKAVVLKDETGHRLMAVVPSMNHLKLRWINKKMNHHYDLVGEMELKELFRDCELGAIPALGQAFQMETICDDQLLDEPVVYLEGGDHEALIKLRQDEFSALMASVHHDRISMNNPQYSPYHDADLGGY